MKIQYLILTILAAITIAAGCGGELPTSDPPATSSEFPFPGPEVLDQLKATWVGASGARLELRPEGGATVNTTGVSESGIWRLRGEDLMFQSPMRIVEWRIVRITDATLELEGLGTFQRVP